jgi:hypothetical protein
VRSRRSSIPLCYSLCLQSVRGLQGERESHAKRSLHGVRAEPRRRQRSRLQLTER